MLLAIPYVAYFEPNFIQHGAGFLVAYVIGLIGYSLAGLALFSGTIINFDSMAGRVGRDFIPQRRPPRQAVVAEVVQE